MSRVSHVAHHMLVDAEVLLPFRELVEGRFGVSFSEAVQASIDPDEPSGFSEYETYANFLLGTRGSDVACVTPFLNRELQRDEMLRYLEHRFVQPPRYTKSVSSHSWKEDL